MYICVKIIRLEFTERIINTNDWATYFLVLCFLLMALAKYFYPRRFGDFMTLPLNNKYFNVHGKDDSIQHPFNIIFFVIQVLCVGIFINLLLDTALGKGVNTHWKVIQICSIYGVFVLGKVTIEKMIGNIFSMDELVDQYLFQKLGYRNFLSIILFCGILFFLYILPNRAHAMIVFAVVILLLNVISLLYSYKKQGMLIASNFFYFILYLCALEISPYIILYKLLMTETTI